MLDRRKDRRKKRVRFLDQVPELYQTNCTKSYLHKKKHIYDHHKVPKKPCIKFCRLCHARHNFGSSYEKLNVFSPVRPENVLMANCCSFPRSHGQTMEETVYNYLKKLNSQWRNALTMPKGKQPNCVDQFKQQNSQKDLRNRVNRKIFKINEPKSGQYFSNIKKIKRKNLLDKTVPKAIEKIITESLIFGVKKGILEKDGYSFKLAKPFRSCFDVRHKGISESEDENECRNCSSDSCSSNKHKTTHMRPAKPPISRQQFRIRRSSQNSLDHSTDSSSSTSLSEKLTKDSRVPTTSVQKHNKNECPHDKSHDKHKYDKKVKINEQSIKKNTRHNNDQKKNEEKYKIDMLYFPDKNVKLQKKHIDTNKFYNRGDETNENGKHKFKKYRGKEYESSRKKCESKRKSKTSNKCHRSQSNTKASSTSTCNRGAYSSSSNEGKKEIENDPKHSELCALSPKPGSRKSYSRRSKSGAKNIKTVYKAATRSCRSKSRSRKRKRSTSKKRCSKYRSKSSSIRSKVRFKFPGNQISKQSQSKSKRGSKTKLDVKKLGYDMTPSLENFLRRREKELKKAKKKKKVSKSFLDKFRNWIQYQHLIAQWYKPWFKSDAASASIKSVGTVTSRSCIICRHSKKTRKKLKKPQKIRIKRKHLNKSIGSVSIFDTKSKKLKSKTKKYIDKHLKSSVSLSSNVSQISNIWKSGKKKSIYEVYKNKKNITDSKSHESLQDYKNEKVNCSDSDSDLQNQILKQDRKSVGVRAGNSLKGKVDKKSSQIEYHNNSYDNVNKDLSNSSINYDPDINKNELTSRAKRRRKSPVNECSGKKRRRKIKPYNLRERSNGEKTKNKRRRAHSMKTKYSSQDSFVYPHSKRRKSCNE